MNIEKLKRLIGATALSVAALGLHAGYTAGETLWQTNFPTPQVFRVETRGNDKVTTSAGCCARVSSIASAPSMCRLKFDLLKLLLEDAKRPAELRAALGITTVHKTQVRPLTIVKTAKNAPWREFPRERAKWQDPLS